MPIVLGGLNWVILALAPILNDVSPHIVWDPLSVILSGSVFSIIGFVCALLTTGQSRKYLLVASLVSLSLPLSIGILVGLLWMANLSV